MAIYIGSYPVASNFQDMPDRLISLDPPLPPKCLKSSRWYLFPAAAIGASSLAIAGALCHVVTEESIPLEVSKCAALATGAAVGSGILSVLGRAVFAKMKMGAGAASSQCKEGFTAFLKPEGVGINAILGALPPFGCLFACLHARRQERLNQEALVRANGTDFSIYNEDV